jgi:FAD/FMN-containing dehydrogenase
MNARPEALHPNGAQMANWSGSLTFRPRFLESPQDEDDAAVIVRHAARRGLKVRPVGRLHSSSPIIATDDVCVSMENLSGVIEHDAEEGWALVGPGTPLDEMGRSLNDLGLATHNLGDINVQTVVGAVSTCTHGSGRKLTNLATMLIGGRMVTADGEVREIGNDIIHAARGSMGTLGMFTALKLRLLPRYRLRRREWCTTLDGCFWQLEDLSRRCRNLDMYWYPRSDRVKLRTLDPPGEGPDRIGGAKLVMGLEGWSNEVLSRKRDLRFDEMEYAVPLEAGPDCFLEVRKRIMERHRRTVGWRVLYRYVAADDAYLSTAHGRDTVTISLHQNNTLPYDDYFDDIERIFLQYGGRPHWGKKHNLEAKELEPLYPRWAEFQRIRRELDPQGVFLTEYLGRLLEGEG